MVVPNDTVNLSYGLRSFYIPKLSGEGEEIIPFSYGVAGRLGDSFHATWDPGRLEGIHLPLLVDEVRDKKQFSSFGKVLGVLDLPIKFPGTSYRIPKELEQFISVIRQIINYEHRHNNLAAGSFAYLTVHCSVVKPGEIQRRSPLTEAGDPYVEGFQGATVAPNRKADHNYVAVNCLPFIFCSQEFKLGHLDIAKHNYCKEFRKQLNRNQEIRTEPFSIYLFDAYSPHRESISTSQHRKSFLRITYSTRKYARLGNTYNPMFDYDWIGELCKGDQELISYLHKRKHIGVTA